MELKNFIHCTQMTTFTLLTTYSLPGDLICIINPNSTSRFNGYLDVIDEMMEMK